jgi:hypothetical protein
MPTSSISRSGFPDGIYNNKNDMSGGYLKILGTFWEVGLK